MAEAFGQLGLNWEEYIEQNQEFMRPTDLLLSVGNPEKAELQMGWKAKSKMEDVIRLMLI